MRGSKVFVLLLCGLLLTLQACCCMNGQCGSGATAGDHVQPAAAAADVAALTHTRVCTQHPEPEFDLQVKPPGPGIAYGTGDFDGGGAVLIKLQIQDLSTIDGNEGTITAWSGNGDPPSSSGSFPSPASAFFSTGGDVTLPYWTSHVLRDYDTAANKYWVAVKVDHKKTNGSREVRYLFWTWTPSTTPVPDTVRNFNEYP